MYCATDYLARHALIARCERRALDAWRLAHAPKESIDDSLALEAHEWSTDTKYKPGGYISVTVSVEARRPYASESYWFSLQRFGKGGYYIAEEASTYD